MRGVLPASGMQSRRGGGRIIDTTPNTYSYQPVKGEEAAANPAPTSEGRTPHPRGAAADSQVPIKKRPRAGGTAAGPLRLSLTPGAHFW